jgi:hypothetical protein
MAHKDLAGGHVHLVGQHSQALEPAVVEPAEQRDAMQKVELFVSGHAVPPSGG